MDKENGGQTSEERQRATAAEIARRKVIEAYGAKPSSSSGGTTPEVAQPPVVDNSEWKKYHSAWQDYYQKYYGKYYHQAARDYVEREKLRLRREQAEKAPREVEAVVERSDGSVKGMREEIRKKASGKTIQIKKSRHFMPIVIGLSIIVLALLVQYYRVIVSATVAYIAPGNGEVNSITEIDPTVTASVGPESRLIIPKINVDVPIVFGIGNDQPSLQAAMAKGVAHFAVPGASAMPGEVGNLVISGHSANGVFETGDYKFIFAPLERLVNGDTIYVNYQSKRYTYTVTGQRVVDPTDVQALVYPTNKPLLTLITCVPLGTAKQRLLMVAEQINPDPSGATENQETPSGNDVETIEMPGNSPTFFEGVWNFLTGQ